MPSCARGSTVRPVAVTGRYSVSIVNTMSAPEGEKTCHKGIELRLHHIQTENCGPLTVYVQVVASILGGKFVENVICGGGHTATIELMFGTIT